MGSSDTDDSRIKEAYRSILSLLPLRYRVPFLHWKATGHWPNLEHPQTWNELIAWRKSFIKPDSFLGKLMIETGSKLLMREYVATKIGVQYVPKLYFHTEDPTNLDIHALPVPSVLKAAHGSGMNLFIKSTGDINERKKRIIQSWLNAKYGVFAGEWWYQLGPASIICEEFLDIGHGQSPMDYKFFVFRGDVLLVQVDFDRHIQHRRNLYTADWARVPCTLKYPSGPDLEKPAQLQEMLEVASGLGSAFDFVRIDIYCHEERILVGELTHAPGSGWETFSDKRVDHWLFEEYIRRNGENWRLISVKST